MKNSRSKKAPIVFTTSDVEEAHGMYLMYDVYRRWQETSIDQYTGDLVSAERSELIASAGDKVEEDTEQRLNFLLQTGDIKTISVTNQEITNLNSI